MCVRSSLFCLKTFSFYKKVVTLRCVIIVGYPIQKRVSPTHVKLMRKIRYILGTLLAFSIIEEYKAKTYNTLTLHSYHIFKRPYLFNDEGAYKGTPQAHTFPGSMARRLQRPFACGGLSGQTTLNIKRDTIL